MERSPRAADLCCVYVRRVSQHATHTLLKQERLLQFDNNKRGAALQMKESRRNKREHNALKNVTRKRTNGIVDVLLRFNHHCTTQIIHMNLMKVFRKQKRQLGKQILEDLIATD